MLIGCSIGVAYWGTSWHVGQVTIQSQYRAGSALKLHADVGVYIGLRSVNITYKARQEEKPNDPRHIHHLNYEEINFNERFYFVGPTEMKVEHEKAKAQGLPYVILTITEYLSKSDEGFCWGFQYRKAGYYAANMLIISIAVWITMLILLCAVPRYGFHTLIIIGLLLLVTLAIYTLLLPSKPLVIPFEDATLTFNYGWSYWLVFACGILATLSGAVISIVDYVYPNKCATILEVDYDTPYRYFVGNDAHLFGGLANGINGHRHPSLTSTESCCGQKALSKQKSDASVSTVESYPVDKFGFINHRQFISSNTSSARFKSTSTSMTNATPYSTTSSRATSGKNKNTDRGKVNDAFDTDEKENNAKTVSASSSSSTSITRATGTETSEINNDVSGDESNHSSEVNEISTDIVHGKRAVSLHNFGRYTEKQQRERDKERDRSSKTTTSTTTKSSGKNSDNNNKFPSTHL